MSRVEPVFCHDPLTLRIVRLARRIDEALRRASERERRRARADVRAWLEQGRPLAGDPPSPM